jgi:hypothetical protein
MDLERDCRYCGQILLFRDDRRTANGTRVPLDPYTEETHQCRGTRQAFQTLKNYHKSIEEIPAEYNKERLVLSAIEYIQRINNRLEGQGCYLKIERIEEEQP